jgi:hypothetical protein
MKERFNLLDGFFVPGRAGEHWGDFHPDGYRGSVRTGRRRRSQNNHFSGLNAVPDSGTLYLSPVCREREKKTESFNGCF